MISLGTPNLSQFATFGYSAGPHLEKDESPTIEQVFARLNEAGPMISFHRQ